MNIDKTALTKITAEDATLVLKELASTGDPVPLRPLVEKLAFAKTAGQRIQPLKRYDPNAKYEVGDLIYKEYDEALNTGSKTAEFFSGAVVLEVVAKTYFKSFNCEMLEVDYSGGGLFRKYIDYMKKTRTQVLLPSNYGLANLEPEVMPRETDPRLTELPMTEQEFKKLEKALRAELGKNPEVFGWNDHYQLASRRVEIREEQTAAVESWLVQAAGAASTEELVETVLGLPPTDERFALTCLSLTSLLDKKFKKEFVLVSTERWGKWHLKRILNSMPDHLPLSAPQAPLPELVEAEKPELSIVQDFPIKVYLTWREILSGGAKIPRSLSKGLAGSREYVFTESDTGNKYTLYYFPVGSFFLGLGDFYKQNDVPQGASLTLERSGENSFNFWVKKSKKKMLFPRLEYLAERDEFRDTGEDGFSYAEPNKIIFLERETLARLFGLYEKREGQDLKQLLVTVFQDPALATPAHSLHFLRAYHLVDMIRQTTQEDVEVNLVNSPEFTKSDKKKGLFIYKEPTPVVEEGFVPVGEAFVPPAEAEAGAEAEYPPSAEEEYEVPAGEEEVPPTPPSAPIRPSAAEAKKEKAPKKKKKAKPEAEKLPRPKKSERRVIEEKIEEEESVQEALSAIKEREETGEELHRGERKEEFKPAEKKEEPKFGFFAEMLKSALKQKKDQPEEEKSGSAGPEDTGKKKEEGK
mgnify:CR=1 FL=1